MSTIQELWKAKSEKRKISMVTCYDAWSAKILCETAIDLLLVGDSAAMIMHGYDSTIPATMEMMELHIKAVANGVNSFNATKGKNSNSKDKMSVSEKHIVGDLPFLSYRTGLVDAVKASGKLIQSGAHSVKLEGADGNLEIIRHLVDSGIPVMGHLGLTPQSIHQLGGFKVQGKDEKQKLKLKKDALSLQDAGCYAIVLECIPSKLAEEVTASLEIPTIGIGAGPNCDGQVLVFQDLLGLLGEFKPKFLKTYCDGKSVIKSAIEKYCEEVKEGKFPSEKESY